MSLSVRACALPEYARAVQAAWLEFWPSQPQFKGKREGQAGGKFSVKGRGVNDGGEENGTARGKRAPPEMERVIGSDCQIEKNVNEV